MSEIKVWKCEGKKCSGAVCLSAGAIDMMDEFTTEDKLCLFSEHNEVDWQPTDDYEIVKVSESGPISPKPQFPKTPNCAVCRWKYTNENIKTEVDELTDLLSKMVFCSAQGYKDVGCRYNTDECNALFEPREESLKLTKGPCTKCNCEWVLVDPETRICRFCEGK